MTDQNSNGGLSFSLGQSVLLTAIILSMGILLSSFLTVYRMANVDVEGRSVELTQN